MEERAGINGHGLYVMPRSSFMPLVKFGLKNEPPVKAAIEYLAGLLRDNGWPCAVSKKLGKFRGPGRKDDPCPFANLVMLKVLSEIEELYNYSLKICFFR